MNRLQRKLLREGFGDLRRRLPDLDRAYRRQRIARWAGRGLLAFAILAAGAVTLRTMGVSPMSGDNGHRPKLPAAITQPKMARAQPSSGPALTPQTVRFGAEARPDGPPRIEAR